MAAKHFAAALVVSLSLVLTGARFGVDANAASREPLKLDVRPAVVQAPGDIYIVATVDANTLNRTLQIELDSGDFYRSSTMGLDGDRAARVQSVTFRSLPPGVYVVRASLLRADGSRSTADRHLEVVGDW